MTARAASAARHERIEGQAQGFWTVSNLTSPLVLFAVSVVALCVLGLIMVFSASSIEAVTAGKSSYGEFATQARYMLIAVVFAAIAVRLGEGFWFNRIFLPVLLILTIAVLILVLAMGTDSHGATRWLYIGPLGVQPSEFAKITVFVGSARALALWAEGSISAKRALALLALYALVPMVLIYFQKDLGTLLIIGGSIWFLALIAGVKLRYLLPIVIVGVAVVVGLVFAEGYRASRFAIWLDPYSDYYGDGWQIIHGLRAFASGGFFGVGIGNSRLKYSWLPEAENDYIFAIVGEEMGFLGCLFVIGLFCLFGWSGVRIAREASERNLAVSFAAYAMTISILLQAFLNMAGVTQILPLTGRTLPFISSGGSSILSCLIMSGFLLSVALKNKKAACGGRSERPAKKKRVRLAVIEGGGAGPDGGSSQSGEGSESRPGTPAVPGAFGDSGRARAEKGRGAADEERGTR